MLAPHSASAAAPLDHPKLSAEQIASTSATDRDGDQSEQPLPSAADGTVVPVSKNLPPLPDDNAIIVTGSRLPRAGFDTIQPAVVLGSEQLANLGYSNLGDALNELPQFGVPGNSAVGTQSGFGAGQTFVDFFGLGTQRTLTLVDGRRFVSSNTASIFGPVDSGSQVDFNLIPVVLVDRVETIAIGGAPIYGSDAIAGTVNIILKRKFDGLRLEGANGISGSGDAAEHRVSAIAGKSFADDRGSIIVAGEWVKSAGLRTSDRFLTSGRNRFFDAPSDPDSPFGNVLYQGGQHYTEFTQYGVPTVADTYPTLNGEPYAIVTDATGTPLIFNRAGRLVPLDVGTPTGDGLSSAGGNGFNISDFGNLRTSGQRYVGSALGSFEFSNALRLFGEAWYAHSKATNLVDQPYYSTNLFGDAGTANGAFIIPLSNPFLDPADRDTIAASLPAGQDSFYLDRANTDLQPGSASSTVEVYRFVTGIDGDFRIGSKPWHYEASLNYGHSRTTNLAPSLVFQNLQNALNAVVDANGNIVCAPGYASAPIKTLNSTCSPFDPFGQSEGATQRAAIDYATAIARSISVDTQFVGSINAQGSLFTLPGGDVTMSVGYEHRRESTKFDPGAFYYGEVQPDGSRIGYGNSIPIDPISGSFHTDEGSAELRIPLISPQMDWRFLYKFELEAAARYVRNSLSGGAWTYTGGGTFAPIRDITFRGNYTRSIRSPAITEVFNPTSPSFETGDDPCDARYIDGGPDPARRQANCRAAGVPIDQPGGFNSNYSNFTVQGSVSGNRNLTNETADSYTFGTVLRPRFVPGLTISADYINISIKNEVVALTGDQVLDACYDAVSFPNAFCDNVPRDSEGQITFVKTGYFNAAVAKLKAVTAELDYYFDLARLGLGVKAGAVNLSFNFYHVIDQYTKVGTGDVDHSVGEIGNPKNSFTANLNYVNNGFHFLWQTEYFGPSVFDADASPNTYQYPGVKHWYVFNTSVGYTVNKTYDLRLIVDNVFDKEPPFPSPAGGGTVTYFSGLLGRYFRLTACVKF